MMCCSNLKYRIIGGTAGLVLLLLASLLCRYPLDSVYGQNRHVNISSYKSRSVKPSCELGQCLDSPFRGVFINRGMPSFGSWGDSGQKLVKDVGMSGTHRKATWLNLRDVVIDGGILHTNRIKIRFGSIHGINIKKDGGHHFPVWPSSRVAEFEVHGLKHCLIPCPDELVPHALANSFWLIRKTPIGFPCYALSVPDHPFRIPHLTQTQATKGEDSLVIECQNFTVTIIRYSIRSSVHFPTIRRDDGLVASNRKNNNGSGLLLTGCTVTDQRDQIQYRNARVRINAGFASLTLVPKPHTLEIYGASVEITSKQPKPLREALPGRDQ
jgi:hypothetical protein